jgi:hypothetical protein
MSNNNTQNEFTSKLIDTVLKDEDCFNKNY